MKADFKIGFRNTLILLGFLILLLMVFWFYIGNTQRESFAELTEDQLQSKWTLMRSLLEKDLRDQIDLDYHSSIALIDLDGYLIWALPEKSRVQNQAIFLEVQRARLATEGFSIRQEPVTGDRWGFFAKKTSFENQLIILRVSQNLNDHWHQSNVSWYRQGIIVFLTWLIISMVLIFFRFWSQRQLSNLVSKTETYSREGYFLPADLPKGTYYEYLGKTINNLVGQLEDRMDTISNQNSELEGILSSMVEGVVLLDRNLHIQRVNPAFDRIFGKKSGNFLTLMELIPSTRLLRFVEESFDSESVNQITLSFSGFENRFFKSKQPNCTQ